MEDMVFINSTPNLNEAVTSNFQLCQTWEVVCTKDLALALPCDTSLNESQQYYSCQIVERSKCKNPEPLKLKKTRNLKGVLTPLKPEKPLPKPKRFSGEKKELGPNCDCPLKCFQKIGEETVKKIFLNFWALADQNSQNAYLFGLINLDNVKRRYTKKETSRRNFTIVYQVKDKGRNVPVCKKAFLNIHGLQKNRGRINNLANKMKKGEIVPSPDKRGRHKNRPNAYSEEAIEHVRRHLLLCPKIDRNEVLGTTLKQMVLSTKRCYALYVNEYCKNNELKPVSLDKFRRIFAMEGYKNACRSSQ